MLTPYVDVSHKGSPPLPLRNEPNMENIVWVNQDGSQELWLCDEGTLKGIFRVNAMLNSLWGHILVSSVEHQRYWNSAPLNRQNRTEQ